MHVVPPCPDLTWYFGSAESAAGGLKSRTGAQLETAAIGQGRSPSHDAESALGRRFDPHGDVERARGIFRALQRLSVGQRDVLARAYGTHDLEQLVERAYHRDEAARHRLLAAFGEYTAIAVLDPAARLVARPSRAKGAVPANAAALLVDAQALLAAALAAYLAARAPARAELAAYRAPAPPPRTATEYLSTW